MRRSIDGEEADGAEEEEEEEDEDDEAADDVVVSGEMDEEDDDAVVDGVDEDEFWVDVLSDCMNARLFPPLMLVNAAPTMISRCPRGRCLSCWSASGRTSSCIGTGAGGRG